jgi:hypothetical protein
MNMSEKIGKFNVDELIELYKTHPLSALNSAHGEGLLEGIERAKLKFKFDIKELIEILELILTNDGGEGSKCFNAIKLYDARKKASQKINAMKGE